MSVDTIELRDHVRAMYREVAFAPHNDFHFETGRELAERLGYPPSELDDIPAEAIDSFAGVGYYFDLPELRPGETALDLGSGSGMDSFLAAREVGGGGPATRSRIQVPGRDRASAVSSKQRHVEAVRCVLAERFSGEGRSTLPGTRPFD